MRTAISTDLRLSTSAESQGNLPDDEDGCLGNEPEKRRLQLTDSTRSDVLSDMPVQSGQQDQESDKPPSGTLNGEDERNDGFTQDGSVNLRCPRDSLMEIGQSLADVPRHSQRHCEPPRRLQYSTLGNPLSLVVQSLLQGLSAALTVSLGEPSSSPSCVVRILLQ